MFEKIDACSNEKLDTKPVRNTVIEWESPIVNTTTEIKNLGEVVADPDEYRKRYNFNKKQNELPSNILALEKEGLTLEKNAQELTYQNYSET